MSVSTFPVFHLFCFFFVFSRLNPAALKHTHPLAGPSPTYHSPAPPSTSPPGPQTPLRGTVDTGFRRISFPSRVPTLVIFSLMKTMTQLAGTCQAYPRLCAAGKTGTASRRACGGLCHRRGARAHTCFFFFVFDSLARVTPPVLLKATVSSDVTYIVAVDVFSH